MEGDVHRRAGLLQNCSRLGTWAEIFALPTRAAGDVSKLGVPMWL
jgi:hypothetical protein